jgi:tmRNA-binding protein
VSRFFLTNTGLAKIDIAVARGKKLYDKRHSLKEKGYEAEYGAQNVNSRFIIVYFPNF